MLQERTALQELLDPPPLCNEKMASEKKLSIYSTRRFFGRVGAGHAILFELGAFQVVFFTKLRVGSQRKPNANVFCVAVEYRLYLFTMSIMDFRLQKLLTHPVPSNILRSRGSPEISPSMMVRE